MINHTQYNPYTLTGRPSNHFAGINYAALSIDQRRRYTTRYVNGFLIEVDLSGFHLHLLYSIVGLPIPDDIYKSLSEYYPNDVDPKEYTFRQIYGGIDRLLLDQSPFFEIDQLADTLFNAYSQGNLTTLLHGRKFILPKGLSKWKLLNYCLQSLETEHNMGLIDDCLKLNLILYTYDSFLFDTESGKLVETVESIKSIFADLKYKVKIGRNYGEMKIVNL